MAGSFSAKVSEAVAKRKQAVEVVFKESAQRIAEIAQTPGPSKANPSGGRGGHMPIDSGFLRASMVATLGDVPPPAMPKPDGDRAYTYDGGEVALTIANATVEDTITLAYTANYARIVHRKYQWVTLAAQRWQSVVAEVAAEAERRLGL